MDEIEGITNNVRKRGAHVTQIVTHKCFVLNKTSTTYNILLLTDD